MYALKNKVQLIGNVGAIPEIKTNTDSKYARFSLGTNETYKNNKGEKVSETQWHNLVCWGKVADLVEKYVNKGDEIAIEGKLTHRDYLDANGIKRYVTEVEVNEILLLTKNN